MPSAKARAKEAGTSKLVQFPGNGDDGSKVDGVPASFQEMFLRLFTENLTIMIDRQKKYGKHNVPRYGLQGTVIRMGDKFARLEEMVLGGPRDHFDESLEDTLIDIANYATIARAQLREWWTKEFCPDLLPERG